jgi:flagellar biosynthesis protein FlgN
MMKSQFEPLNDLLQQQQAQLDALLLLLRQELAAIAVRDINALDVAGAEKQTLLAEIETIDQSIANNPELTAAKAESWFKQQLDLLEQVLADCKQQNDVNQIAVEQSQLTLQRFKTELLSARGKSGLTYTNKGKPTVDNIGKGVKA